MASSVTVVMMGVMASSVTAGMAGVTASSVTAVMVGVTAMIQIKPQTMQSNLGWFGRAERSFTSLLVSVSLSLRVATSYSIPSLLGHGSQSLPFFGNIIPSLGILS
jgi:hypothetical protein